MINLEKAADNKGRGIWKEQKTPLKETTKKFLYKCLLYPFDILKYMFGKARNRFKK